MRAEVVSTADYRDACENYTGWCTGCHDFTRDGTEPDAEGYDCPACEQNLVMGAEQALMLGIIDLK